MLEGTVRDSWSWTHDCALRVALLWISFFCCCCSLLATLDEGAENPFVTILLLFVKSLMFCLKYVATLMSVPETYEVPEALEHNKAGDMEPREWAVGAESFRKK